MYDLDSVASDAEAFRRAVRSQEPYCPLYVKIKLIYGCNLRCEMCKHWREPREAPLSDERLFQLMEELAAMGCRKIHFSGGEPLLRSCVPALTARATELGLRVNMTTNGTLVTKALARELSEAGLRGVNVSVDSPIRKVHDRVRGVEGAWKKTVKAVEYFHRAARKGKTALRINTVVNRWNYDTLAGLPDFAKDLGADDLYLIPVDDHCGEHLALTLRHMRDFNTRIAPAIAERALELGLIDSRARAFPFGTAEADLKRSRRGHYALGWYDRHPCYAPWTHSLIDYNGLVYVCCMTRERISPLGDLKQKPFAEIWNGPGYRDIRGKMHPPSLEPCRRCDDYLLENRRLFEIATNSGTTIESAPAVAQEQKTER